MRRCNNRRTIPIRIIPRILIRPIKLIEPNVRQDLILDSRIRHELIRTREAVIRVDSHSGVEHIQGRAVDWEGSEREFVRGDDGGCVEAGGPGEVNDALCQIGGLVVCA